MQKAENWLDKAHLIYRGEIEDTPNQHLQICMGGLQVWLETADMLEDDRLKILLERLGAFYFLPPEEKCRITEGRIQRRSFAWPMLASGTAAYSAMRSGQLSGDSVEYHQQRFPVVLKCNDVSGVYSAVSAGKDMRKPLTNGREALTADITRRSGSAI